MAIDYKNILNELEKTVRSLWSNNENSRESLSKGQLDIVTETDLAFEKVILKTLSEVAPGIPILSEETLTDTKTEGTFFTVDPVDGTWNYANNIPIYGTQISMLEDGEPTLGLIYLPTVNQMFTAAKGMGSYLNGKQIYTNPKDINKAEVAITDLRRGDDKVLQIMLNIAEEMTRKFGKTRMVGAACFDHAMVAAGGFEAKISYDPHLWDIAPGLILVREAGGVGEFTPECAIVAANQEIFDIVKHCYKKALDRAN